MAEKNNSAVQLHKITIRYRVQVYLRGTILQPRPKSKLYNKDFYSQFARQQNHLLIHFIKLVFSDVISRVCGKYCKMRWNTHPHITGGRSHSVNLLRVTQISAKCHQWKWLILWPPSLLGKNIILNLKWSSFWSTKLYYPRFTNLINSLISGKKSWALYWHKKKEKVNSEHRLQTQS